jgi:hypothetical protein
METGCKLLSITSRKCVKFNVSCRGDIKDKSQCPVWVDGFALENALENYYNQKLEFEKGKADEEKWG